MLRLRHFSLVPVLLSLVACSSDDDGGGNGQILLTPPPQTPSDGQAPATDGQSPMMTPGATDPSGSGEVTPGMLAPGGVDPNAGGETGGSVAPTEGEGSETTEPPPEETPAPVGPVPSAGCGNASPPSGNASIPVRGVAADYFVNLPPGYDGTTPVPLIFAFHGRNRTHIQLRTVDAGGIQSEIEPRGVVAYLKSQGGIGWNFPEEVPVNVEFFDALYPQLLETYCIDTSRVFAIGHSSGGYFSAILACRHGDLLRGIGSVAGAFQEDQCTGDRVAGMFIHGVRDIVVANAGGRALRDQFIGFNGCQQSTQPGAVSPCVAYDGCAEGFPVQWCEHDEPTYVDEETGQTTNHGWPSFASRAIAQFFNSLP